MVTARSGLAEQQPAHGADPVSEENPEAQPGSEQPVPAEPPPTDFSKHIWLLVAILATVLVAGLVSFLSASRWDAGAGLVPHSATQRDRSETDDQR